MRIGFLVSPDEWDNWRKQDQKIAQVRMMHRGCFGPKVDPAEAASEVKVPELVW